MKILLALRNLPNRQTTGGPQAAARLLGEALLAYKDLLKEDTEVLFFLNTRIMPLQKLVAAVSSGVSVRGKMWTQLQRHPHSLWLNALHSMSLHLKSWRIARDLHNIARSERILVHSFIPNLSWALARPPRRLYKVLHSEHSKGGWSREYSMMYPDRRHSRLVRRMMELEASVVENCDVIIFPSRGALELFREWHSNLVEIPDNKVRILYTGVQDWMTKLKQVKQGGASDTVKCILNVAHHVPEKRVDRFVKAYDRFLGRVSRDKSQDFIAVNYGQFTALTQSLVRSTNVIFKGLIPHNNLMEEMNKCWVLVSVPEVAVFDLVLLEAMSLGKPIIASKVGGNIEALGEDYPLYASEPEEIADILLALAEDPVLYKEISQRNRNRYLRLFTLEAFVRRHIDLWQEASSVRE